MAKLFIPQIGNEIKLINDWDCKVFNEDRNRKVFEGLNIDRSESNNTNKNVDITFPKGTIFRVDRVYVRAPASSFDSITFSVVYSPIKSLKKSRFWVKLMEANNIEFEEVVNNMDSQKKLKDLFRFVALKNEFQNSERLSPKDSDFVSKEIFDYFNQKNNKLVKFTFKISAEDLLNTIQFDEYYDYYKSGENKNLRINALNEIEKYKENIIVQIKLLPVLDGWVIFTKENEIAINVDKSLNLYGKVLETYWTKDLLGSSLSRNSYVVKFNKKEFTPLLEKGFENLDSLNVEYQGEQKCFKSNKDFDKFLKYIRN